MSNYPLDFLGGMDGLKVFVEKLTAALNSYREWYNKNAETIKAYLVAFADMGQWFAAIDKLEKEQIIFTDTLTLELAEKINGAKSVEDVMRVYYFENNDEKMKAVVSRCKGHRFLDAYANFLDEIESAYLRQHYQLTCAGVFALADGVLSDVASSQKTNFTCRTCKLEKQIEKKMQLSQMDQKLYCILATLDAIVSSMFGRVEFSAPETAELNRNRVQHGRTHRQYTKYDVLKVWLYLDAILFLSDVDNTELSAEE